MGSRRDECVCVSITGRVRVDGWYGFDGEL